MCVISLVNTLLAYFFLRETHMPTLLARKKQDLEKSEGNDYYYQGKDDRSLSRKLKHSIPSIQRPMEILITQPIVITIASYQTLIFTLTYSLYTQMQSIYSEDYGLTTLQVGLLYLFPGAGILVSVWFLVPYINTVSAISNIVTLRIGKVFPESRLLLAILASILLLSCIFWFALTVQYHTYWIVTISSTFFYGMGLAVIFNCVQNYYIDVFEKYAASAIAAGAFFTYLIGGIVLVPGLFENLGIGRGMFVFAFIILMLAPSPCFFFLFGADWRKQYAIEL